MPLFPVSSWDVLGQVGGVKEGSNGFLNQVRPAGGGCTVLTGK